MGGRRSRLLSGRPTPPLIGLLILSGLIAARVLRGPSLPPADLGPGDYRVQRVVDGDTLLLTGGERVRLLGVDTPETKHPDRPVEPFGPEASAFTRRHVEGKLVRLEFDRERRDKYRRMLAYVYVGDWFLNEELIRAGFSEAETGFPYSPTMKRRFRKAEEQARGAGVGIWSIRE